MTTEHLPKLAQSGITDRPAEHMLLVAFDLVAADPAGCHAAMERLRAVIRAELHGHPADSAVETGELGYEDLHKEYGLMVLMALSDSGYSKLGATAANRPLSVWPAETQACQISSGLGRTSTDEAPEHCYAVGGERSLVIGHDSGESAEVG